MRVAPWIATFLVLCASLTACDDDQRAYSEQWEPRLARPDHDLEMIVAIRKEYLGHLELDRSLVDGESVEDLRQALINAQPIIEKAIDASNSLDLPVPDTSVELYDDDDVLAGNHLASARSRAMFSSRLLLADSVRLWEEGDQDGAGARLAASFRLGLAFADVPEEQRQIFGRLILYPTIYTMDGMFRERPPGPWNRPRYDELFALFNQSIEQLPDQNDDLLDAYATIMAGLGMPP
jgi:hypothetical protein